MSGLVVVAGPSFFRAEVKPLSPCSSINNSRASSAYLHTSGLARGWDDMATRSGAEQPTPTEISKPIYSNVTKVWVFWFVGTVIGAIGLKPTAINAGGLSLTIERPEIIQGLVYLAALFYSFHVFMQALVQPTAYTKSRAMRRYVIWASLPKGTRSLRGATKASLTKVKENARRLMIGANALPVGIVSVPVFLIVVFNPLKVLRALGALVGF